MTESEKSEPIVYLSCIEEIRYSFVSHLSEALHRKGLNDVVVDSADLLSKDAQATVGRARVSVMVLPGNRTVSLGKLVKVLECQRNNNQVVVPVLYGVSSLQDEWLSALALKGLTLVHQSRKECSDAKLVQEIVRDVYEKLFYMDRIGIYLKLLEIENMVRKQPLGIRCLGIWGMPGIGKTTLAKAVFDQMSGSFDAFFFIEDYDKAIDEKGLYCVLEEIFLKEEPGAADSTILKLSLLREKLNNKKVLIVLDDVRDPLVAESFLRGFDWLGSESLIIITSRDKKVFRLCRVSQIYELQGLDEKESLQLFSMWASIDGMAQDLAVEVIEYTNGNPLALSIYGGELRFKNNLSEMRDAFLKLKRRPPSAIVDVVRSSYDTLSDSEKNIFLDISCFFRGENVDYVMQLLEGCNFFPHVGVDVLVDKCLVTISANLLQMHNLIQDVGREIINGETIHIERRSRLWEPWSIKYLLEYRRNGELKTTFKRPQGTEDIEGMFLDTLNLGFDVKPDAFENMLNLRLLKIYSSNSEIHPVFSFTKGFLTSFPKELRLLHWENYPLQFLPQSFNPLHLVEINMPYSQLEKLWGGTKNLEMLRTIRLCHSHQLVNIDDLLKAQNVEVIDLQGCIRLQSFPDTGQLLHLRVVNLSGCTEIKSFPDVPPNIERLHLQGTGIMGLPLSSVKPTTGELESLLAEFQGLSDVLKLERVARLGKSSSSCRDLGKLIYLDLKDCSCLRSLPNMVNLEFLKVLDLSGSSELETIQGFPKNLKELYVAGTALREVPKLPQSLELMNAHGCVSLNSVCLDSKQLPMHYTFSNCFDLSPQVVNSFLVKVLANVKHIPSEHEQEINKAMAFSFCAPSHTNQDSILDLQPGSSVMTRLNSSWKSTLVGFAMLVEVAFLEDFHDAAGFGISCVCRWKNKEGHSHRIERNLNCWAPGKALPKVQKDHMFVFLDAKMSPSTGEANGPSILADLAVFEFFPVDMQKKRLDNTCTVTKCGVYLITSPAGNTSLEHISPVLSLDPVHFSGDKVEVILRSRYEGLQEIYKALFLYIACLFNNEDFSLVAPLLGSTDLDISSGLKDLANRSLIRVASNGGIVMHCLVRQMAKEILHRKSMLPGSSKDLTRDFQKVTVVTSSSRNWKYDVYPSLKKQDVGEQFLSHFREAFKHKSIITFKDNETDRDKLSSPLLVQAIRDSRISIVVFSKKYASSSWLLNELVEIFKCRLELGQKVIPIFYDIDPLEVRKQTGEFGRHFKQTCKSKTEDVKHQWHRALMEIANITGYYYWRWDDETNIIEKIVNDVSNTQGYMLSTDVRDLVGIKDHIGKMNALLCLESEEVKMVGIWGPPGIGKTTFARILYSEISSNFQLSAFIDVFNVYNKKDHMDEYSTKLYFQQLVLSEIWNQEDIRVRHLGVMQERLRHRKVLIILDGVDNLLALDALAGNNEWFGSGSRIIVITRDLGLLKSHGINYIYEVDFPSKRQALQMFCQFAFGQNSPPTGFMELATEVAESACNLPLGLRVFGSYLRGMSKEEWLKALPRLRNSLNGEIVSILKFGYDGLFGEDKDLFLKVACLFNHGTVDYIIRLLTHCVSDVENGLRVLAEKSFIQISEHGNVTMHHLQQHLGREIVRRQCVHEPGKRQFLVDFQDIFDVLEGNTGTNSVVGISLDMSEAKELIISEKGFSNMTNLQFLKFYTNLGDKEHKVRLPHGLDYLSHKLRLLHWEDFPLRCMPCKFIPRCLVELTMKASKLEELWSGIQPLQNLQCMNLRGSVYLKEIPDLSCAINLEGLDLGGCSSLKKLPPSIRNLHRLKDLDMERCIHLEALPTGINLESLGYLNLNGCSQLRSFPEISRSISDLYLDGTAIEEVPGWIENIFGLSYLSMYGCNKLKKISPNISKLKLLAEIDFSYCGALTQNSWQNHPEEISTSLLIVNMSGNIFERLPDTWTSIQPRNLILGYCRNLVSLPELPASLSLLVADNCSSLENLYGSFHPWMALQFINCFKLNNQARESILHSDCLYAILPGGEIPAYFSHRVDGNFLTVSLPQISLAVKMLRFRACVVIASRSDRFQFGVVWHFGGRNDNKYFSCLTNSISTRNHLITFGCEFSVDEVYDRPAELNYSDVQFEFFSLDITNKSIEIKECGVQLVEIPPSLDDNSGISKTVDHIESGRNNTKSR